MRLQGRSLRAGMSGPDVAELHAELAALGYEIPGDERSRELFGAGTAVAVADFQHAHGLLSIDIVDAGTAEALGRAVAAMAAATVALGPGSPAPSVRVEALPAAASVTLQIRVLTSSGQPVAGATVVARDGSRGSSRVLGSGVTDYRGEVRVAAEGSRIRVAVLLGEEELARSPVLFSPADGQPVRLVVRDDLYQGASEFERVAAAVGRVLGESPATEIEVDDIEDLASAADAVPTQVAWYVQAMRLARFGVPAEVFYALLSDGMPAGLPSLLGRGADQAERALRRAYAKRVVPRPAGDLDEAIQRSIERLEGLAAQGVLHADREGDPRLRQAIEASGVPEATRAAFAGAWVAHRGDGRSFWAGLRADPRFNQSDVDSLEFALRASALVSHHRPALHGLAQLRRTGSVRSLRDLAAWDLPQWERFVAEHGVPDRVPGENETERRRSYAETLERVAEDMMPSAFLAHRWRQHTPRGAQGVAELLDRHPDIDISRTVIARYVDGRQIAEPGVIENLKRAQRVYQVTPRLSRSVAAKVLLDGGIESAAQIVHMGADGFVDTYAASLEGVHPKLTGRALAATVFEKASKRNGFSVALMSQLGVSFNTLKMTGVPQYTLDLEGPGMATLRELFGSLDYCACEHCRSVFGPAAYLVDLLAFLQSRPAVAANQTALDVLRSRRPDLTGIELSCQNTNTVLPYIDLVLEILERVALNPNAAPVARQTAWPEEELRIAAEHHDPAAYGPVATAAYPWTLPFALSAERMRAYLSQLGVPRDEVMRVFGADEPALVAESLAMSRHELQLVSAATAFPLAEIAARPVRDAWGMAGNAGWLVTLSGDIATTLEHSRLSYDELLSLFTLDFVNPPGTDPIAVHFDEPSCDLADARLVDLTEAGMDRIHRFVRLWRNRDMSIHELDRIIRVLGAGVLNFSLLATLSEALRAARRFRADLEELLVLWRPLDTRNYGEELSPYHRLFQNRKVTREPDPAFAAASGASEISNLVPLTAPHRETLRAATRLSAEDLDLLIAEVLGGSPQLDLASLSILVRHARLASLLRLRVADLLRLLGLAGIDPFTDPRATMAFADEAERIRGAKVRPETLDYALRHRFHADAGLHPVAEEIDALLQTVVAAARRIDEALSAVQGEPQALAEARLSAIFADPAHVREWLRLLVLADADLTAPDQAFLLANFGSFVDAAAVNEAIAQLAGLSGPDRFAFVAGLIAQHLQRTGRWEALVQILAAFAGLAADRMRVLVEEVLGLRAVLLDDAFLASGQPGDPQREAVARVRKAAIVVDGLGVAAQDLAWYFTSPAQPQSMDLGALPLSETAVAGPHYEGWRRVRLGIALREHLGSAHNAFADAARAVAVDEAMAILAEHTSWAPSTVAFAVGNGLLGIGQPNELADPFALERIAAVADLVRRAGVEASTLAGWARQTPAPAAADAALRALRARYSDEAWPEVITPIADRMRERQRDALLDFIIATTEFRTPLEIYAHYLIDPETAACMLTSRIRLAISSVQLFVQRVLMNLEQGEVTLPPEAAQRWKYIKLYRVWEADRKVFFYPENWVEPQLRDDKTPFFAELEQHLNQGEIDDAHVEDGYRSYLRKLHEVAHLETVGIYRELDDDLEGPWRERVHVLSRTRGLPHKYFYRMRIDDAEWTPWQQVPIDIQGEQVTLVAYNRRLFVFWMELSVESEPAPPASADTIDDAVKNTPEARKLHYVRIGWTEFRDGKWAPKKLTEKSKGFHIEVTEASRLRFVLVAWRSESNPVTLHVDAMVRPPVPGNPSYITFAPYFYDDCRDEVVEITNSIQFSPNDMGMGHGMVVNSQFHAEGSTDTALDVLTYHPEQGFDEAGYRHNELLYTLPLFYRVTAARQRRAYLGDTPVVFDDDDHAFYIVPVHIPVWRSAGSDSTLPDPVPVPIVPGDEDPWQRFVLAPSATSQALVAMENRHTPGPAMVSGPVPWGGRVPGVATLDAALAVRSLEVAGEVLGASQSLELAHDTNPAPAEGEWVLLRRWRIDMFHHPYTCRLLSLLNRHGVEALFTKTGRQLAKKTIVARQGLPNRPYRPSALVAEPDTIADYDFLDGGAYSVYNWELFLHAPMLIAECLRREGRYAEAQRWYHFIFDPTRGVEPGIDGPERFWNIKPLFEEMRDGPLDVIKTIFSDEGLQTSPDIAKSFFDSIARWLRHPFSPHAIARVRMGTYQKVVVRKYLDNLIDWADSLFRQDTIESINEATQLYLLAATMLGERPRQLAELDPPVRTYDELAFPILFGGLTELEGFYPPDAPSGDGPWLTGTPPTPPVWWYFCLPPNDQLLRYWDTVADRLFKIRHCQNIDGVERQLRLFEPPIDPALLVKAVASGVDIGAAVADLHAPRPHYRYATMIGKAIDLTADVRVLGGELLSALEKKDAEALALLRSEHEIALLNSVRDVRTAQVREAEATLEALGKQRETVAARSTFYFGREKISPLEKASMALDIIAAVHEVVGGTLKGLAGALALVPDIEVGAVAIVPKTGATWGGGNLEASLSGTGDMIMQVGATLRQGARTTGTLGEYNRRYDDWQFQGNQAALELNQLDKQITAAEIRLEIVNTELRNHDRQVEQARQTDEYLRTKFTNTELYDWMVGQVSAVFFQSYKLAYDMAKKAQRALQFELGREDLSFIEFGQWDSLRRGLMSGELLHHSLKRMDAAHTEHNARELELTKRVSLRRVDPGALLSLRETGSCTFSLDEILFDLDHPGHYFRRIKSVGLSLNATVDDHTSPGAKLSLIGDQLRINTQLMPDYPRDAAAAHEDTRFRDGLGGIQSIATSRGRDDAGLFELRFEDQRYLPFEGAGAVSRWRLELPPVAQYDYRSISDVEIQVLYTARDGGGAFRGAVSGWVEEQIAEVIDAANATGLVLLLSATQNFATAWERFLRPVEGQTGAPLPIPIVPARFPFVARSRAIEVDAVELVFVTQNVGAVVAGAGTVESGAGSHAMAFGADGRLVRGAVELGGPVPLEPDSPQWMFSLGEGGTVADPDAVDDLLVLVRYHIVTG